MRVGICILIVAALVAGFYIFRKTNEPQVYNSASVSALDTKEASEEALGRYYNERFGFSFKLPEGAKAHEHLEGPGTVTITIEDLADERAFQVFVTPYEENSVTEERMLIDIPSGQYAQKEKITLDGVSALAFISKDSRLGELREIWVIREGYLFEITTLINDEIWLSDTLLSWKFEQLR